MANVELFNSILNWAHYPEHTNIEPVNQAFGRLSALLRDTKSIREFTDFLRTRIDGESAESVLALHRVFYRLQNPTFVDLQNATIPGALVASNSNSTKMMGGVELTSTSFTPASNLDSIVRFAEEKLMLLISSWEPAFRRRHVDKLLDIIAKWVKPDFTLQYINITEEKVLEGFVVEHIAIPLVSYLQACGMPVHRFLQVPSITPNVNISLFSELFFDEYIEKTNFRENAAEWCEPFASPPQRSVQIGPDLFFWELKIHNLRGSEDFFPPRVFRLCPKVLRKVMGQCFSYLNDSKYLATFFLLGDGSRQYLIRPQKEQPPVDQVSNKANVDAYLIDKGGVISNPSRGIVTPRYSFQQVISALLFNDFFGEDFLERAERIKDLTKTFGPKNSKSTAPSSSDSAPSTSRRSPASSRTPHTSAPNSGQHFMDQNSFKHRISWECDESIVFKDSRPTFTVVLDHQLLEKAYPDLLQTVLNKGKSKSYVLKVFSYLKDIDVERNISAVAYLKDTDERKINELSSGELSDINWQTKGGFFREMKSYRRIEGLRSAKDIQSVSEFGAVPKVHRSNSLSEVPGREGLRNYTVELSIRNESEIRKALESIKIPKFYEAIDNVSIQVGHSEYFASIILMEYIEPITEFNQTLNVEALSKSIADGLDAFHALGIIYYDVHLDNLRLGLSDDPNQQEPFLYFLDFDGSLVIQNHTPIENLLDAIHREQDRLDYACDDLRYDDAAKTLYLGSSRFVGMVNHT